MEAFKKIFPLWFVIAVLILVLHQVWERIFHIHVAFLDNFLDPVLLMPITLHLLLWEKRMLFKRGVNYVFSPLELLLYFVLISIVCEYLFPRWNSYFIADFRDVICYGIGTVLFMIYFNTPAGKKRLKF